MGVGALKEDETVSETNAIDTAGPFGRRRDHFPSQRVLLSPCGNDVCDGWHCGIPCRNGFMCRVVAAVWAIRALFSRQGRESSGIVAPIGTILIGIVVWSVVIASAVAAKKSMDARQEPHSVGGQTEQMK